MGVREGYKVWARGVTLASVVVVGACGSRNALPGGLAVDDEDDGDATHGTGGPGGNSGGSGGNSARAVNASTVVSTVGGTAAGMAVSTQASGSFGSSGSTTGFGGSPTCDWPDSSGGQGGGAGAPSNDAGCAINFCGGWVPREGNCANMQGPLYIYWDEASGGSSTARTTSSITNQVCVAGEVGRVIDGRYDVYWGAGFGVTLNQADPSAEREPYDAEYYGVDGFGFWLDGFTDGGQLRFTVRGEDDYYCESVYPSQGYHEFWLDDLIKGCWDPMSTEHDYSRLLSLEWHFVSNAVSSYSFEMCMSGLSVLRRP